MTVHSDRDRNTLVAEHGGDLQLTAERLDVVAQSGEVNVAATLQARDVALSDPKLRGKLDLGDLARPAQLCQRKGVLDSALALSDVDIAVRIALASAREVR